MTPQEFFLAQVKILKVAEALGSLPLHDFLANVPEAEKSIENIGLAPMGSKARALLSVTKGIAEKLLSAQKELKAGLSRPIPDKPKAGYMGNTNPVGCDPDVGQ